MVRLSIILTDYNRRIGPTGIAWSVLINQIKLARELWFENATRISFPSRELEVSAARDDDAPTSRPKDLRDGSRYADFPRITERLLVRDERAQVILRVRTELFDIDRCVPEDDPEPLLFGKSKVDTANGVEKLLVYRRVCFIPAHGR